MGYLCGPNRFNPNPSYTVLVNILFYCNWILFYFCDLFYFVIGLCFWFSIEAEYRGLADTASKLLLLRWLLMDMSLSTQLLMYSATPSVLFRLLIIMFFVNAPNVLRLIVTLSVTCSSGLITASFHYIQWSTCKPLYKVTSSMMILWSCFQTQIGLSHTTLSLRGVVRLYTLYVLHWLHMCIYIIGLYNIGLLCTIYNVIQNTILSSTWILLNIADWIFLIPIVLSCFHLIKRP